MYKVAVISVIVGGLSFVGALQAQNPNATLTARVTDPSKAAIRDANVTLINMAANVSHCVNLICRNSWNLLDMPCNPGAFLHYLFGPYSFLYRPALDHEPFLLQSIVLKTSCVWSQKASGLRRHRCNAKYFV
jgi:hypothetical protein